MSARANVADRINLAFWGLVEAIGFALKVTGLLALLGGFIVIAEQTLHFMQTDVWRSRTLLWALPESILSKIVAIGDLAGFSGEIVAVMARTPLSAAILFAGVCVFLCGRILARDH